MQAHLRALMGKMQQQQQQNEAKIQKVQPFLRERAEFATYYFPKVVSIGPIHHFKVDDDKKKDERKINLEQGEEFKKMWASMYLNHKGGEQKAQQLLASIRSQIETLKKLYTEDVIQDFTDDELAWIFFVDGCAVLHVINDAILMKPIEALEIIVQHDLLLLENQLPYQLLKMLSDGDDDTLRRYIKSFLELRLIVVPNDGNTNLKREPTHLLDLLRTTIVREEVKSSHKQDNDTRKGYLPTHRNIKELITSGIKIKPNGPMKSLISIDFHHHRIYLSQLTVDAFTAQTFLNLTAYEMCPDFKNEYEINNYVSFLNSLIDHEDDVIELRKAGVLHNFMGSDEEVAKIFNTVTTYMVINTGRYAEQSGAIEKYYKHKWRTWFTELRRKHFRSPWAIIGLMAWCLGIILTVLNLWKAFSKHL